MLEVLITMTIVSIGLLGLAKMQAGSLSNTQATRVRALVALQASSLAAAMHGNRGYWAAGAAPAAWSAAGSVITDPSGVLSRSGVNCAVGQVCDAPTLAAYDVQSWVATMNAQFPSYSANVNCTTSVSAPISCALQVLWTEKVVAYNRSTAASAATQTQQFTLYVEP
jgi:type IV pilus assembly protein PilV